MKAMQASGVLSAMGLTNLNSVAAHLPADLDCFKTRHMLKGTGWIGLYLTRFTSGVLRRQPAAGIELSDIIDNLEIQNIKMAFFSAAADRGRGGRGGRSGVW